MLCAEQWPLWCALYNALGCPTDMAEWGFHQKYVDIVSICIDWRSRDKTENPNVNLSNIQQSPVRQEFWYFGSTHGEVNLIIWHCIVYIITIKLTLFKVSPIYVDGIKWCVRHIYIYISSEDHYLYNDYALLYYGILSCMLSHKQDPDIDDHITKFILCVVWSIPRCLLSLLHQSVYTQNSNGGGMSLSIRNWKPEIFCVLFHAVSTLLYIAALCGFQEI